MGGKKESSPPTPAPAPSVGETSAQAIQAQLDALPKILAAQQQYGGQFSQAQLDALNEFGPQFAQQALNLQQQFMPQYQALQNQLNPELGAAQSTLANYLGGNDQQEYDSLAPGLLQQVRAGQSQRGIGAISPLGSIDESVQLQQLKQSLKDRRLNVALSTAGRQPIGQTTQAANTSGVGQLVQNVDPNSIFGYQKSLNDFNSNIFGVQSQKYGNQQNNRSPFGSILGGIAGAATGGFGSTIGTKFGSLF